MGSGERDLRHYGNIDDINVFAENSSGSDANNPNRKNERRSVVPAIVWGAVAVVAASGTAGTLAYFDFDRGYNSALKFGVSNETTVLEAGTAKVQDVDLRMGTFQLGAASTKTTGTKLENIPKTDGADFLGIPIPDGIRIGRTGLTREAEVNTDIVIDLDEVNFEFDPNTKKLTIDASNTALSTEVSIKTATAKSKDIEGSFITLVAEQQAKFNQALKGDTEMDMDDLWIVGDAMGAAEDAIVSSQETHEQYADLFIATQVDKQCTPLITQIPTFDAQLKKKIGEVAGIRLLDKVEEDEATRNELSALADLKFGEVQDIVADAEVILPEGLKIGNDQGMIDTFNGFKKASGLQEATANTPTDQMECGVSKDTKLVLDENKDE